VGFLQGSIHEVDCTRMFPLKHRCIVTESYCGPLVYRPSDTHSIHVRDGSSRERGATYGETLRPIVGSAILTVISGVSTRWKVADAIATRPFV